MAATSLTPAHARRLAITKQRLAGPRAAPTREGLLEVARDLGCAQLDAISAVDRSDRLVQWAQVQNGMGAPWLGEWYIEIADRAGFLGATAIDYDARRLPAGWKKELPA